MGQKIKPTSLRIGIIKDWSSRWLPKKFKFEQSLREDFAIRSVIQKKIGLAGLDAIVIDRTVNNVRVLIRAAKPGLIIGRGGKGVEELTQAIEKKLSEERKKMGVKDTAALHVSIEEIKRHEVSSAVLAQNIAWDLEKRFPFRKTIKKYLERIMQNRDVKGAKIRVSGRLDGGEIARSEQVANGNLPLQTLRADIDYAEATAFTTFGTIGVKVWIYKGEIFESKTQVRKQQ